MKAIHSIVPSLGFVLSFGLSIGSATAQDAPTPPGAEPEDTAALLAAWQAAAQPGDPHAMLADQAGAWTADAQIWTGPDEPPTQTTYAVERSMELDGRVLLERWSGRWMGQPFHGIGRTGYDNVTNRYWGTWTDNMSTGLMTTYGLRHDDGSVHMAGSYPNPLTGEPVETRLVWRFPDEGTEVMESYEVRDGEEFMNMKMTLTRADD